jgi:hypothetical protein
MLIGTRYKVESNSLQITVYEKGTSKETKKVYWRAIAYYTTVAAAIKGLLQLEVRKSGLTDLETVQKAIERVEKLIDQKAKLK